VLALPKGHIDPGESAAEAAQREVREEAGVRGELVAKLGDVKYWYSRDGDRVTLRVLERPMGLDVLDDLIASGDLAPSVRGSIGTLQVGNMLEWTAATANATYTDRTTGRPVFCRTDTNLNVQADRFPAATRANCKP